MDQIRKLVDKGTLLNFDACVQSSQIAALVPDSQSPSDRKRVPLCAPFYKTPSWRGGISPGIDDRKDAGNANWTPEKTKQFTAIRDDLTNNINNAINTLNTRTAAAALDYPGAVKEVEDAKQTLTTALARLASEGDQISGFVKAMQEIQNGDLITSVREKELDIRKLETENKKYEFQEEASNERVKEVLNKYEGNQHDMIFSYSPFEESSSSWYSWSPYNPYINLNPMSRSGLLFLAFFFGFLAVMAIGVKAFTTYAKFKESASMFSMPTLPTISNPFRPLGTQVSSAIPNPGRFRY
jgi:hypothetical protein